VGALPWIVGLLRHLGEEKREKLTENTELIALPDPGLCKSAKEE